MWTLGSITSGLYMCFLFHSTLDNSKFSLSFGNARSHGSVKQRNLWDSECPRFYSKLFGMCLAQSCCIQITVSKLNDLQTWTHDRLTEVLGLAHTRTQTVRRLNASASYLALLYILALKQNTHIMHQRAWTHTMRVHTHTRAQTRIQLMHCTLAQNTACYNGLSH